MSSSLKQIPRTWLPRLGFRYWNKRVCGRTVAVPIDAVSFSENALFSRESPYLEALLARVKGTDTVFDIGAHQGLFALAAARLAESVVAFEPNASNREKMGRNLRRNRATNVHVLPVAVAEDTAIQRLWVGGEQSALVGAADTSYHPDFDMVVVVSLDALGLLANVLKVDVEGFEYDLIVGARETLGECRCLGVEIHPPNLAKKGQSEEQVVEALRGLGFEVAEVFKSPSRPDSSESRHHLIFERS